MVVEDINDTKRKEIINLRVLKAGEIGDIVQDTEGNFGVIIKEGADCVKVRYPDGRVLEKSHLYESDDLSVINYIHQRESELDYARQLLRYEDAKERLMHIHNGQLEFGF